MITRRSFLQYAGATAVALGLSRQIIEEAGSVLASASSPSVIWLSGAACTGCSVSLLNAVNPTIDDVLLNTISLKYHTTLMSAAGDMAVSAARSVSDAGGYILVVEGSIPTAYGGKCCYVWDEGGRSVTMAEALTSLAAKASQVVAVGTCAAYGGIPGAYSATSTQGVGAYLGRSVINLPGCPSHPDWIVGSLVQLLAGAPIALDSYRRPTAYYKTQVVHERCPRRETQEARVFGQDGRCLEELGCKGPKTHSDCDTRLWNNRQNWCIGANGLCLGCTEPSFPAFPLHKGGSTSQSGGTPQPTSTAQPTSTPGPGAGSSPTSTPSPVPSATSGPGTSPTPTRTPEGGPREDRSHRVHLPLVSKRGSDDD